MFKDSLRVLAGHFTLNPSNRYFRINGKEEAVSSKRSLSDTQPTRVPMFLANTVHVGFKTGTSACKTKGATKNFTSCRDTRERRC